MVRRQIYTRIQFVHNWVKFSSGYCFFKILYTSSLYKNSYLLFNYLLKPFKTVMKNFKIKMRHNRFQKKSMNRWYACFLLFPGFITYLMLIKSKIFLLSIFRLCLIFYGVKLVAFFVATLFRSWREVLLMANLGVHWYFEKIKREQKLFIKMKWFYWFKKDYSYHDQNRTENINQLNILLKF